MTDKLTDAQIDAIVNRVKGRLGKEPGPQPSGSSSSGSSVAPHLSYVGRAGRAAPEPAKSGKDGIYPDLDSAVAAARARFVRWTR